jgi:hypothetical protein
MAHAMFMLDDGLPPHYGGIGWSVECPALGQRVDYKADT